MRNVYYSEHKYAIASLEGLLRVAPTINNTADDVRGVVDAIVDVIQAMRQGKLPNHTHRRRYS